MKSQIKQLENEIIHKDEEIIKLNKEIMDFQNSISLGKSKLVEEEIKEKKKPNILENVINKTKSLTLSEKNDIPNEVLLELENKKLKKKNEELETELNTLKNKFTEEKNSLVSLSVTNQKEIEALNKAIKNKEDIIYIKNKELNENQQRIEMFLNNDKIWESEKNKFNTELKKYQEKVTSLESELKVKDETLQKWQIDIKKYEKENMELYIKIKNLNNELTMSKTKAQMKKFKCEIINQPKNDKCDISIGPTGEGDYVMRLQMKEDEYIEIKIIDVEYIRENKQKNILDVSILHNENYKRFSIYNDDETVLSWIKTTFDDYSKIALRAQALLNINKN